MGYREIRFAYMEEDGTPVVGGRIFYVERSDEQFTLNDWEYRNSGGTLVVSGTLAEVWPTWQSIVLMCCDVPAVPPDQWANRSLTLRGRKS